MNSLVDIQTQIQKLQKQAEQIKAKEFEKTIRDIREKMLAFGITPKDLLANKTSKRRSASYKEEKQSRAVLEKAASRQVANKYRGPGGETWTGRGLTPRWLKALLDQGRKKEEFLISN